MKVEQIIDKINGVLDDVDLIPVSVLVPHFFFGLVCLILMFFYERSIAIFLYLFTIILGLLFYMIVRFLIKKILYRPSEEILELRRRVYRRQKEAWKATFSDDYSQDHSDLYRLDNKMIELDQKEQKHPFNLYYSQPVVKLVMSSGSVIVAVIINSTILLEFLPVNHLTKSILGFGILLFIHPLLYWPFFAK